MNMNACFGMYVGRDIQVVKVEQDGNPAFLGALLYAKFQTKEKIEKAFKLGDYMKLCERLRPESNIGHYLLKKDGRVMEIRFQEGVSISKHRDIRSMEGDIIKKNKVIKPRIYNTPMEIYLNEGVDYIYVFNPNKCTWETWGCPDGCKRLCKIKVDYMLYIRNLVCREDISPLTETELNNLCYLR